jgi:general secretion pathway protein D
VNILSTPNILASNNKEAEIVVGQKVPFVVSQGLTTSGQPLNQVTREDVALTLRVTPQINESDDITMTIFQQIQDIVASSSANTNGPTTSNRSAKTTALVKNGQTVTIGGLISDIEAITESKVPILGDIPLLGWFFKDKQKQKRKTSLVIFITPHIIRTPDDMMTASINKNEERTKFLQENNVGEHPGIKKYNMNKSFQVPENLSTPKPEDENE